MFDIVRPGHMRHLMYAKGKADVLIASLTADAHATKAAFRPCVPQELRAENLAAAAFEFVDYVIIDPHPTSIEHIKALQPDFFARGYEYFADDIQPRTQEENLTVSVLGDTIVDNFSYFPPVRWDHRPHRTAAVCANGCVRGRHHGSGAPLRLHYR